MYQNSSEKPQNQDHISVCICTFRRPLLLERLLKKLEEQITEDLFTYSIIVVDNDSCQSGESVVTFFKRNSKVNIDYYHEPKRSISLARNKSVKKAKGNLIAFIDDDEFPGNDWLLKLYGTIKRFPANGVLGPVKPHFEKIPPSWIKDSKILERESFKTGEIIPGAKYTRTGNVLLYRNLFEKDEDYFDPVYGRIGGGDAVFFKRMMEKGKVFVWCNEAIVYETVPPERQKRSYYVKRAFTRGMGDATYLSFFGLQTLKSVIAFLLYTPALPFFLLISDGYFMKYLIKDCDHMGKLLAFCGIRPVKERPY